MPSQSPPYRPVGWKLPVSDSLRTMLDMTVLDFFYAESKLSSVDEIILSPSPYQLPKSLEVIESFVEADELMTDDDWEIVKSLDALTRHSTEQNFPKLSGRAFILLHREYKPKFGDWSLDSITPKAEYIFWNRDEVSELSPLLFSVAASNFYGGRSGTFVSDLLVREVALAASLFPGAFLTTFTPLRFENSAEHNPRVSMIFDYSYFFQGHRATLRKAFGDEWLAFALMMHAHGTDLMHFELPRELEWLGGIGEFGYSVEQCAPYIAQGISSYRELHEMMKTGISADFLPGIGYRANSLSDDGTRA